MWASFYQDSIQYFVSSKALSTNAPTLQYVLLQPAKYTYKTDVQPYSESTPFTNIEAFQPPSDRTALTAVDLGIVRYRCPDM
ncbi:MAG: hypothetical protein AAFR58_19770 [Cyanobacteria bacterium J06627_28]